MLTSQTDIAASKWWALCTSCLLGDSWHRTDCRNGSQQTWLSGEQLFCVLLTFFPFKISILICRESNMKSQPLSLRGTGQAFASFPSPGRSVSNPRARPLPASSWQPLLSAPTQDCIWQNSRDSSMYLTTTSTLEGPVCKLALCQILRVNGRSGRRRPSF